MPRIRAASIGEHRALCENAILDACDHLLRAGRPVTMSAVARLSGLPRSTVYEYFTSVDAAVEAAHGRRFAPLRSLLTSGLQAGHPPAHDQVVAALAAAGVVHTDSAAAYVESIVASAFEQLTSTKDLGEALEQATHRVLALAEATCIIFTETPTEGAQP